MVMKEEMMKTTMMMMMMIMMIIKVKIKVLPITGHESPEGE